MKKVKSERLKSLLAAKMDLLKGPGAGQLKNHGYKWRKLGNIPSRPENRLAKSPAINRGDSII